MKNWKDDLKEFFKEKDIDRAREKKDAELRSRVEKFYLKSVRPAFKTLKKELERYGRQVNIAVSESLAAIEVEFEGRLELNYQVKVRDIHPYLEIRYQDAMGNGIWSEANFREGSQQVDISGLSTDEIIQNFLREYKARLWVLYKKRSTDL
ncbi:MAG: hypothetical protein WBC70_16920 [Candidatus Aminicenantales bacterium]